MASSMSKRRRDSDPGDATAESAELKTVYVDTSLGTHLAVLVRSSDTVSDFKQRVAMEHKQCFPEVGEIQVHSVKVKRKANYYHLPDVILVWSAFLGVKKNWFLSVDASNIPICLSIKDSSELGTSSGVKTVMTNKDDDGRGLIFDANMNKILPLALLGSAAEENVVSEMIVEPKVIKPVEKTTDSPRSIYSEEHYVGIKSPVKKKRKVRHTKDNYSLEGVDAMVCPNGNDWKPNMSNLAVKASNARNNQFDTEGRLVSDICMADGKGLSLEDDPEGIILSNNKAPEHVGQDLVLKQASLLLDAQKSSFSDGRKEDNALESRMDSEPDQDAPTMHVEDVCINIPDMDGGGGSRDVNTDVKKKKKKKKVPKAATESQDTTDMEQIGKDERIKPSTDYMAEGKGLSLGDDPECIIPSNNKAPEHVGPDLALKEASLLLDAQKSSFSDGRKEDNALESKMDSELDQDVPTVHVEGVIPDFSAALMDGGGCSRDVNTDVKKKKKKKKVKKTAIVQDTTTRDEGLTGNGEMKNTHETIRAGENGLSLGHDNEVMPPSDSKAPDHVYPDLGMKEASIIQDADDEMEPQISSCIKQKKKKRLKKSVINMENSGIAEIHSIRSSLDWPSSSGTGKKESIGLNDGKDVEMVLDASNHDAQENIWDVNRKEADLVETQTEQTLEDVSIGNKMMTEKTRSSAGDCYAETENTIMKSNHTDKDNENTENRHTKSKKKKKRRRTVTDVQENLPVENQKVGSELLATKPTSDFADSELDGRYVDSSQVLSRKSEEKVDEKHEPVLNTDGHAENSGKSGDGINFKSYFVADQLQNKVDSSDKVRKTTRSTRSSTKAESNDLPSVNIPIEVENSVKSLENKKPENNSYREDIVRTMYDSVHNSDGDEMSPNSLKISSKTTEKEVKDSSPELGAVTSEKHDDIVTGSSLQKKIPSLDNSSSERSQTLHNNVGNEMPQLGQNATSMMPMKTPKKKISSAKSGAILHNNGGKERPMLAQNATNLLLIKTPKKKISLAKSGAIFEDNSGESSGDENGTMHSDAGTLSPSDSSSTLGDSAGESELSQSSVNNGCNDAKEKSPSKFDLSATEDLTMDVILRSSKRFKKAKQLASQNETEPIEFVPDSLPL